MIVTVPNAVSQWMPASAQVGRSAAVLFVYPLRR